MFYALDKKTGQERWSYDIKKDGAQTSFHGEPLIAGDLIIIGTDGGHTSQAAGGLYAFEIGSGKVRWRFPVKAGITTDVIRGGDLLYAVTMADELVCVELQTGRLKWSHAAAAPKDDRLLNSSPAVSGAQVFFGTLSGQLMAFAAKSGQQLWKRDLGAPVSASILAHQSELYVGLNNGRLLRVNQKTGETLSETTLEGAVRGVPVRADRALLVMHGKDEQDQTLTALDSSLQKILWQQKNNWCSSRPHLWRGQALLGNTRGEVAAAQLSDGAIRWSEKLRGPLRSIGSDEGVILAGTQRGLVFAFTAAGR